MSRRLVPPVPLFPGEVPNDFICSVCHELPLEPVLTPCEHCFCRACIDESLAHRSECPIDRRALDPDDVTALGGLLRRVYDQTSVKCPHEGCSWNGKIGNYANHAGRCSYRFGVDGASSAAGEEIANLRRENERLAREKNEAESNVCSLQSQVSILEDDVLEAEQEIENLERNNERLSREKRDAECKVQNLNTENDKLRKEKNEQKDKIKGLKTRLAAEKRARHAVTYDESYGYDREDVVALTQLICEYLLEKPDEIDSNHIFNCVRNIYIALTKNWNDNPDYYYISVRMLINVCHASTWFTYNQQRNFEEWLADQGWG
mmetsp:Transcript_9884/g.20962  ORF Transcript_9884/g.20962 Transcript_9884/m.20962 type:complete len:319 (-) Transcript_9884:1821-2777(-)